MKTSVTVDGVVLRADQVKRAWEELNKPEDVSYLHLAIVRRNLNGKKGVVLTVGEKILSAILAANYDHKNGFSLKEFPVIIFYDNGSINGYTTVGDLLEYHEIVWQNNKAR